MSKVIRVDDDVYEELRRLARPFDDTPNSVLRHVLGFEPANGESPTPLQEDDMHPWVAQLLAAAGVPIHAVFPLKTPRTFSVRSRSSGKVVANLQFQPRNRRVKIAAPRTPAEKVGLTNWERVLENGFYKADDEVYWSYRPDDGSDAVHALRTLYSY